MPFLHLHKNMYKYERIIYWSDIDNKFIVEVPELSGCMADGDTVFSANQQILCFYLVLHS